MRDKEKTYNTWGGRELGKETTKNWEMREKNKRIGKREKEVGGEKRGKTDNI